MTSQASPQHFDAIVIGSGFGGSVSAYRLAEAGKTVCILERGRAYPPGSFPRSPYKMRDNFWDPDAGLYGLFDVWSFRHIASLVSAGLGGGSLIYANVLLRKDERWFVHDRRAGYGHEDWPVTRAELDPHYDNVENIIRPQRYPFEEPPYDQTPKTIALQEAALANGLDWFLPPLAVTFANKGRRPIPGQRIDEETRNLHDRDRYTCQLVGECDVGCNYGSKNSLDFNYLTLASKKYGAEICTGADVKALAPRNDRGYEVTYEQRPPDPTESPRRVTVTCDKLVVSAGTFGTTYLLLKHKKALGLSDALGKGFSGNGDTLGLIFHARNASDEARVLDANYGPVIASTIRVDDQLDGGPQGRGFYIQDAGYPAFASWLAEYASPLARLRALGRTGRFAARRYLSRYSSDPASRLGAAVRELIGDCEFTKATMPLLGMGRDMPGGEMSLVEGQLELNWNEKASDAYFSRVTETMSKIASTLRGRYRNDPVWALHKYLITVHPLGGARMGRAETDGVVDSFGEVFGHPDLHIADGSIMPGPVGPNPSLTIAALADRGAEHLIENW
ncbi:MAG: GMC family oxidoreductase [Actinomycetota bacterium]|nr:GMC family oxidoreductase [Actinomycetota bacterium]